MYRNLERRKDVENPRPFGLLDIITRKQDGNRNSRINRRRCCGRIDAQKQRKKQTRSHQRRSKRTCKNLGKNRKKKGKKQQDDCLLGRLVSAYSVYSGTNGNSGLIPRDFVDIWCRAQIRRNISVRRGSRISNGFQNKFWGDLSIRTPSTNVKKVFSTWV